MMQAMPRLRFPGESLLVAMLGDQVPADLRRAARRLRAEGAPALAIDDDIAGLARGLATTDVSRSPGVLDGLPPLFWIEARREGEAGGIDGWVVEKKGSGLAMRGFSLAPGPDSVPEPRASTTLRFGAGGHEEDEETLRARGLVTAVGLPQMMAQMGESSPVVLMPADAAGQDAALLRGFRLAVAISPESVPS